MVDSEVIEKLKHVDEVTLLEFLDISTEDILDAFQDKIEERLPYIMNQLRYL